MTALLAGALAGCSTTSEAFPAACGDPPEKFLAALSAAPHRVVVDGTRISACFPRNGSQADVETLGTTLTAVADELSTRVRTDPGSQAMTELGYLMGASERGAARTGGIHYELVRRLSLDLAGLDTRSAAYARGHAAGRRFG